MDFNAIQFILEIIRKSVKKDGKLYLDNSAYESCGSYIDIKDGKEIFFGVEVVKDNTAIFAEVR